MATELNKFAQDIISSIKQRNYPIRSTSVTPVRIAQELFVKLNNGKVPNLVVSYCLAFGEMKEEVNYVVRFLNREIFGSKSYVNYNKTSKHSVSDNLHKSVQKDNNIHPYNARLAEKLQFQESYNNGLARFAERAMS